MSILGPESGLSPKFMASANIGKLIRKLSGLSKGLYTPSGSGRYSDPPCSTLTLRDGEVPMGMSRIRNQKPGKGSGLPTADASLETTRLEKITKHDGLQIKPFVHTYSLTKRAICRVRSIQTVQSKRGSCPARFVEINI